MLSQSLHLLCEIGQWYHSHFTDVRSEVDNVACLRRPSSEVKIEFILFIYLAYGKSCEKSNVNVQSTQTFNDRVVYIGKTQDIGLV